MTPLISLTLAGCLAIAAGSDRITAGDLARMVPAFAALDPRTPLAPAPLAGARRLFHGPELRRLALAAGLEAVPEDDVCVEREVKPLDPKQLRASLGRMFPGAAIAILDFSRAPAPEGQIEFPPAGLRQMGEAAMCRGYVLYGGGQRFPIWAQARISATEPRVLALAALPAGRPIAAGRLRVETRTGFPGAGQFVASLEDAEGKIPLRSIAAGTAIRREWLAEPKAVERGDPVVVEARAGAARLEFEAVAEAAGSTGDLIPVLNPVSKRRFLARVEGKGRASVQGGNP